MNNSTNDFSRFHGRLHIRGQLELITPLRIGSGRADDMGLADIAVIKDYQGNPFIPGSSFKGVLRSYVESILRTIDDSLACLCVTNQKGFNCPTTKEESDRKTYLTQFDDEDDMYLKGTCRVCQVFGSGGLASKVQIPDMKLVGEWIGRYQLRYGVSIDRDTETAAAQRLFTGEAVPAGTRFQCEVIVENGSTADQGLVLLGLAAFERELVPLGGATSRGLGKVKLNIENCEEIPADPNALIEYLMTGKGHDLDANARQARIAALREELEAYHA